MNFVADNLFNGRRIRALTVVDNFSRECLDIHVGHGTKGEQVVARLEWLRIFISRKPARIQVDNGSEFISKGAGQMGVRERSHLGLLTPRKAYG